MTDLSAINRQPETIDYSAPTQYRFTILQLPKVQFFTTACNVPGINMGEALFPTPFKDIPILPDKVKKILIKDYGLSNYDAQLLSDDRFSAEYFFRTANTCRHYKAISNWIMGPIRSYLNENEMRIGTLNLSPSKLADLINAVQKKEISLLDATKQAFRYLVKYPDVEVKDAIGTLGIAQVDDFDEIQHLIADVLADNPDKVKEYHNGKKGLIGMFMGLVMKKSVKRRNFVLTASVAAAYASMRYTPAQAMGYVDDAKNYFNPEDTICIVRGSVARRDAYLDLISQLEKVGISVVNSRQTISICADKYRSALRFADTGVPTPKTALVQSEETLQSSLDIIGEEYPMILKTLRGSKGVGVIFIESRRQLTSLIQLLMKQDEKTELLLQSYIKSDFDVRVIILNNEILASMRRDVLKGDFRSNYSQGAKVKEYSLTSEEKRICMDASKAVDGIYTAVDFIKNGKDTFVLEVNSSPGTEGIEEATGRNLIKEILVHFKDRDNWQWVAKEIGRFESIHIKGVGNIVANFDTGNSARCIIHADKYTIKNDQVMWEAQGKKFKNKLIRMAKWERGAIDAQVIERPLVSMNVDFNGTIYEDVKFAIDDRTEKTTKCLMNQDFM